MKLISGKLYKIKSMKNWFFDPLTGDRVHVLTDENFGACLMYIGRSEEINGKQHPYRWTRHEFLNPQGKIIGMHLKEHHIEEYLSEFIEEIKLDNE